MVSVEIVVWMAFLAAWRLEIISRDSWNVGTHSAECWIVVGENPSHFIFSQSQIFGLFLLQYERIGIPVLIPVSSTHRRNVWICVWSQLLRRDNRVGRLRSGWPLCSQFSFCHLYRSGPRQQGCGPPQVRMITHTHTQSKQVFVECTTHFEADTCINRRKWLFSLFLSLQMVPC